MAAVSVETPYSAQLRNIARSQHVTRSKAAVLRRRAFTAQRASRALTVRATASVSKPTLIDVPVSNHGARVRYILYAKGLENEIDIVAPKAFGGLSSPEYLQLNPCGKMPALALPDGLSLYESEVIVQYLVDKYADVGERFRPSTAEQRARAALVARVHDIYITPIQGCLYREMDAEARARDVRALAKQLDTLETLVQGPYVCGSERSTGDAALFPTLVFMDFILPSKFGWRDVFNGRPKLQQYWRSMQDDPHAARVIEEVRGGLQSWDKAGRWEQRGICDQVAADPDAFRCC